MSVTWWRKFFFRRVDPSVILSEFSSVFFLLPTKMATELELPTLRTPTE
jgi:hypothetical protein